MASIITLLNRFLMLNYCLLAQTALLMRLLTALLMDSMKKIDGKECNTARGVSIAIEFDKFKDVLFNEKIISHKMKRIQSKKHKLRTSEIDIISLSCFDDKEYVLDDGILTLAYFHKGSVTGCSKNEKIKKDCDN